MNQEPQAQDAQFNAGVAIALELHSYFVRAAQARVNEDFWLVYTFLKNAEIRMSPKFRLSEEATKEVADIHNTYKKDWEIFMRKYNKRKNVSKKILSSISDYLNKFESSLSYWRDHWKYGMPSKDDPRFAL